MKVCFTENLGKTLSGNDLDRSGFTSRFFLFIHPWRRICNSKWSEIMLELRF